MPTKARLDKIEQEILELKEKQEANEKKITSLEEELAESYRRVKELESAAGNTSTIPTSSGDRPNSSLRQKIADIERKLKHLQEQLQGAQNNLQDGFSDVFKSSQKKIKEHRVALNLSDYSKLAALESIAGLPNGPANQIGELVFMNFQSDCQEMVKKLKADGITAAQAVIDYSSLSSVSHALPNDTNFFFLLNWYNNCWKQVLFGANSKSLYLLDLNNKKVIKEWKMRNVTECKLDTSNPRERHIRVEFGAFCVLKLRSNEMMEYYKLIQKFC